jgi:chromate reductase, NAD(P)H dehydrogenase (quinone)
MTQSPLRILAVCGSLRARSSNGEVLRAAALLAPASVTVAFYNGIGALPHFNPDDDGMDAVLPATVVELRAAIAGADALLISSPEYAHGVPGSLKNALDWLVSGPEMPGKPTGLLTASTYSTVVHASLAETLRTMSADLVPEATRIVPLDGRRLDAPAIAADAALSRIIREAMNGLADAARRNRG